jgi:hypothetical protein
MGGLPTLPSRLPGREPPEILHSNIRDKGTRMDMGTEWFARCLHLLKTIVNPSAARSTRIRQHSRYPSAQLNCCPSDTFFERGTTRGGEDDLRAAGFWCGRWRRYRAWPFPCAGRLLRAPPSRSLSDGVPGACSTARRLRGEIVLRPIMGLGTWTYWASTGLLCGQSLTPCGLYLLSSKWALWIRASWMNR